MLRKEKIFRRGGVTLLEIMLVLAIAAVIIVMSVRYYQSASASQRANACVAYLQAVAAAMDSLSEATQSYSGITSSEIDAIVPRNEAVCNKSATLAYPNLSNSKGFSVYIQLPEQACLLMLPALKTSGHWTYSSSDTEVNLDGRCSNSFGSWIYYSRAKLPAA